MSTIVSGGGGGGPGHARSGGHASSSSSSASLGPYMAREAFLSKSEADGDLAFAYLAHDGTPSPATALWLVGLKGVYARQLPNMPREYISRLVFDPHHRSVAIVRRGGAVVGGITYRAFPAPSALGEVAFCAVMAAEQVKGFGTRLMNHCKAAARDRDGLGALLTYADNNAVGYFAKQGFTKEISLPRERWVGFIKDYDGGTLMECILDPHVPYTALPPALASQRAALDAAVRARSRSHVVHPGLAHFAEDDGGGSRLGSVQPDDGDPGPGVPRPGVVAPPVPALLPPRGRVDPATIPGVPESGWPAQAASAPIPSVYVRRTWTRLDADPTILPTFLAELLEEVKAHEDAWPFASPVDARDVPDYYQIIRDPMDLSTVADRLAAGAAGRPFYTTLDLFVADVRRIFANCRIYNAADTVYSKLATRCEADFDALVAARVAFEKVVV